jgi:hypothetical protein
MRDAIASEGGDQDFSAVAVYLRGRAAAELTGPAGGG